jgi:SAM-dependent methyltransferase
VIAAYNQAGAAYVAYADGNIENLFALNGPHAYADRYIWTLLKAKLEALRAAGKEHLYILDAGCGPGTWLCRLVIQANELGFKSVTARGFDCSANQIARACALRDRVGVLPGVQLLFEAGDITDPLPEPDQSVDLLLCLYSVLNHLPPEAIRGIAREMARVTRGCLITTVRAIGSPPTAFIDSFDKVTRFQRNPQDDLYELEFLDGRKLMTRFHLFSAQELATHFNGVFASVDIRGLDLFHTRFRSDPRWNPDGTNSLPFFEELICLEERHATDPCFVDNALHLLVVAQAQPNARCSCVHCKKMRATRR